MFINPRAIWALAIALCLAAPAPAQEPEDNSNAAVEVGLQPVTEGLLQLTLTDKNLVLGTGEKLHPVYSLNPEPYADGGALVVSLDELLELAVENNFGVQRQHNTIERNHFSVDQTYYAFDPSFGASLNYNRRAFGGAQAQAGGGVSSSESYNLNTDYRVPREFGDAFSVGFGVSRSNYSLLSGGVDEVEIPTTYNADFSLGYSRPLGRGAGKYVNRIPRFIASNNALLSYEQLDDQVRRLKADVIELFFQAVAAREAIGVRETSLIVALQQLERVVERYKVGLDIRADMLQAENSALNQRSQLLSAITAFDSLRDQLTGLIGLPVELELTVDAGGALLNLGDEIPEGLWELVRANSFNLKSLNTQLANLRLNREQQADRLKPNLGLSVNYGRSGEEDTIGPAVTSFEDESYSIGLSWETTPGERSTKADIASTDLDIASLELSIQEAELALKNSLRALQRDLETRRLQVELAAGNLEVLRETHQIQVERNNVGLATTLDVVEAQEALLAGELNLLNAQVAYHQAYRDLQLLAGLI